MATPSAQIAALWVKESINEIAWRPLRDILFSTISAKWSNKSDEEVSDYVEEYLDAVAELLRNDVSECNVDGTAQIFEIDSDPSPYVRSLQADNTLLRKLRSIDPFMVEEVCSRILIALGATAKVTKKTGDGGVDFIARDLNVVPAGLGMPTACKISVIGQTKRYKRDNVVIEKAIREFVGAAVLHRHILRLDSGIKPLAPIILAFWTTSSFEPNAKAFARNVGLWYMDGNTLALYVRKLNLEDWVMSLPDDITSV